MQERSEQVFQDTQIDKYIARPDTAEFNNMCMATFFSQYHMTSTNTGSIDLGDEDETDDEVNNAGHVEHYVLQKNRGHIKKRKQNKPAIIRYPRVSVKKDSEKYHMNMLRLYLPHRTEKLKPDKYSTYESYHLTGYQKINNHKVRVSEIVQQNMKEFEPETGQLDNAWEAVKEAADLQDAWAAIAPQAEQQRLDNRLENDNTL